MSDGNLISESSKSTGPALSQDRVSLREQMREIIRAEVDKLHPTDDARRALELIIEASVRYTQADGALKITVVDQQGQPRTIQRDGHADDFTIRDLLEELRASHPILFKPAVKPGMEAVEAQAPQTPRAAPRRDWLDVGSDRSSPEDHIPLPPEGHGLFHLKSGRNRFQGWLGKVWKARASATSAAGGIQSVRSTLSSSAERTRDLIDGFRERPPSYRPGFTLGAVALVALLAIGGAFAFLTGDSPTQASVEDPTETGAISSAAETGSISPPARAAARTPPPRASSGGRALRGVPEVIDTTTLSLDGEVVRLFGVEWAPGAGKPEDLNRYLQGREVVCEPAGPKDTYRCEVGGQDLSRVVLYNGGGQPTAEATPELKAAADRAREAKIGVWRQ